MKLVGYYLRKKIASQRLMLDVIRDIDLYRIEPWDLQDKCQFRIQSRTSGISSATRIRSIQRGQEQIGQRWQGFGRQQEERDKAEEGWVVCRAFKKKITGQTKSNMVEGWESNYFYDEATTAVSSVVDPLEYITRQHAPPPSNFNMVQNNLLCKQEMEAAAENNLNFTLQVIHNSYSFHS
ncbi:hypothetical protein HAX54_052134 [Datura stramonium]|uniref:NAC domain-containing protein n=1 Tax=Datura stramonium TaxID=4076 RepID=A0ABS8RS80_DATST|nr:hypothetical protein [Datura stramonium]